MITTDPLEKLDAPHIQREMPHILSQEQIGSLFRQVEVETAAGMRDLAMLHMLYATGMRVSELVSLNLGDFDAGQATIVCPGRNGRSKRARVSGRRPARLDTMGNVAPRRACARLAERINSLQFLPGYRPAQRRPPL